MPLRLGRLPIEPQRARFQRPVRAMTLLRNTLAFAVLTACGPGQVTTADGACAARSDAIFNGSTSPAPLELDPEQRSAIVALESRGSLACSGVLIGSNWVLSAAHCADAPELSVTSEAGRAAVRGDARVHPSLDAMLLELEHAPAIRPLSPWTGSVDESWVGEVVTLAGRGMTESGAVGELLFAREPVISVLAEAIVVDGRGMTGACVGDSGGPLLVSDALGQVRVAGILGTGSADCLGRDRYARADVIAAFITEVTRTRESDPSPVDCL
jgi:hypothetical protein